MRVAFRAMVVALLVFAGQATGQEQKPEVRTKLEGHRGGVTAIAFSRDGKLLATGSGNGIVFLWDAKSGEQLARLNQNNGNTITGVALSADGARLAASGKGLVAQWDATDPKSPKAMRHLTTSDTARYVGVGATGDELAFAYTQQWRNDYPARVEFSPLKEESAGRRVGGPELFDPRAIACAPDADSQATAVYGIYGQKDTPAVFLFGLGDVKTITRGVPALAKDGNYHIVYSLDGKWLGVCSGKDFAVWRVPGSQIIGGEPLSVGVDVYVGAIGARDLAVTASLPVEGAKTELTFWKLGEDVKKLGTHKTELSDVRCLAFSPDGNTLAVGGYTDGVVQLWSLNGERKLIDKKDRK
jgi:WD40 repeat protein